MVIWKFFILLFIIPLIITTSNVLSNQNIVPLTPASVPLRSSPVSLLSSVLSPTDPIGDVKKPHRSAMTAEVHASESHPTLYVNSPRWLFW